MISMPLPSSVVSPIRRCALACLLVTSLQAVDSLPYGHADFYPTPDRPIGLQGDGSGFFPAATPAVSTWDIASRKNIIWAATLPSFGFSSPIVVGDKVFVTAEFNQVICINARNGKTLWVTDCDTIETVAGDKADAIRKQWEDYHRYHSEGHATHLELAYLHWQIDSITKARSGKQVTIPGKGYKAQGPTSNERKDRASKLIYPGLVTDKDLQTVTSKLAQVSDTDLAALKKRLQERQADWKQTGFHPSNSAYVPVGCPYPRKAKDKIKAWNERFAYRDKLRTQYGLFLEFWNGWMNAFPTPVSDGKHVYVQLSHTQVACLDMDGTIVWMKVFPEVAAGTGGGVGQNYSASPILDGNRLYTIFGGDRGKHMTIRCQDTASGETLWTCQDHKLDTRHSFNQIQLIKIGDQRFLASGSSLIIDCADGKALAGQQRIFNHQIPPPMVQGDTVYFFAGGGMTGNRENGWYAVRIIPAEPKASVEYIWACAPKTFKGKSQGIWGKLSKLVPADKMIDNTKNIACGATAGVFIDGTYWIDNGKNKLCAIDITTGQMTEKAVSGSGRAPAYNPRGHVIRAGEYLITSGHQNNFAWHAVLSASDPSKRIACNRLGSEVKRRLLMQDMSLDEVLGMIREHHYDPGDGLMNHSTVFPQGDRLYIRTKDSVFCIGDSSKAYHSPAGAPAAARTE